MAATVSKTSSDGTWRVELSAFKTNLLVYKAIGATLNVQHRERARSWWPWGPYVDKWVDRAVPALSVQNAYQGVLPSLAPSVANRSCGATNASSCDCRLWAVGIGISVDASANTGLPDPGTAGPSGGASLDVRSVTSNGRATLPGGEVVAVGPATAGP